MKTALITVASVIAVALLAVGAWDLMTTHSGEEPRPADHQSQRPGREPAPSTGPSLSSVADPGD